MSHRNFFLSFLCLILFLSISTPVFAVEEPDLSGGVITSIPRQRFLENINPTHFSTANDPADLISYLQEQLQNISSLQQSYQRTVRPMKQSSLSPGQISRKM